MEAQPTFDQLQVFLTVVETGSFSAAARALNRAQSVVSYTIANLEAQLEVQLFKRAGSRHPRLTEAGKAMLTDARRIAAGLESLRARARSLKEGVEAELSLAISVMVPSEAVVASLRAFREKFPAVPLNLTVGELGMVHDLILSGKADVGFSGALLVHDDRITPERIGHSYMVPVAAPDHPLARLNRRLTRADVREEVQIVVMDSSGITRGRDFNVHSYKTWRVSDIVTKHRLISGGLGWGGLPDAVVRKDIEKGRLVELMVDAYEVTVYPIYVLRRTANPPGPAASWLIASFREHLAESSGASRGQS